MIASFVLMLAGIATAALLPVRQEGSDPGYCVGTNFPCTNGILFLGARGADGNNTNPLVPSPAYADLEGMEEIAKTLILTTGGYCRAVPYPAVELAGYQQSVDYGISQAQKIIQNYVDACGSSSRIVLLGYSTGAQVMTSTLVGEAPSIWALGAKYAASVSGGVIFGSTTFRHGYEPIDAGNSSTDGVFAADPVTYHSFNQQYGNRVRSYCQADDAACAGGGLNATAIAIHLNAIRHFKADAISFLSGLL